MVQQGDHLFGQFDVAHHRYPEPVPGLRRKMAVPDHECLAGFEALPALLGLEEGMLGGVDHNDAGLAVDDDDIVVSDFEGRVADAQHGRDLEGPGNDAGVRGAAAAVGDEALDALQLDLAGFGRREVAGHQDDPFIDVGDIHMVAAHQILHDAVGHVGNVLGALPEVVVGHPLEHGLDQGHHFFQGPLGVDALFFDHLHGAIVEHLVFQEEHVGLQDLGGLAELFGHAVDDAAQRFPGLLDRGLEAAHLGRQVFFADDVLLDDVHPLLVHEVGLADADTRRSADPLENDFLGFLVLHGPLFSKAGPDQLGNAFERIQVGIVVDTHGDPRPFGTGQGQNIQQRCRVSRVAVLVKPHAARSLTGQLGHLGGRAGVQPEGVDDRHGFRMR